MDAKYKLRVLWAFAAGLAGACSVSPSWAVEIRGTVPASMPAGAVVAVPVNVPEQVAEAPALTGLLRIGDGQPLRVSVQGEPADTAAGTPARAWFTCKVDPAMAGKPVTIEIDPAAVKADGDAYKIGYTDPLVKVASPDGDLVLAYRHGKPDPSWRYPLTSFIHPLIGLDGEVLTDCITKDHPHHRGVFWAWVRIQHNGKSIGEWWIPRDLVLEAHDLKTSTGPLFAEFKARHYWVYHPATAGTSAEGLASGDRLIDEMVVCRVFQTTNAGRAIDVDLTMTGLVDGLAIGGQTDFNKGYSGLTVRWGSDATHSGKTRSPRVVADGKFIARDTNHLVAHWIDWTAVFDGKDGVPLKHRSGGAVFVHPSHPPLPASPPEWITRNYGPINVAYPGLKMLDLPKGKPVRLRYRIWLHRDNAGPANVAGQYAAYAADWNWQKTRQ